MPGPPRGYASAAAALSTLRDLHRNGTTTGKTILSFEQFNELVDLPGMRSLEARLASK